MDIEIKNGNVNQAVVRNFNLAKASAGEVEGLKEQVYTNKIVLLKNQDISPDEFKEFSLKMGVPEEYYQPMYHHPKVREIFVSSNIPKDGKTVGVPKTGRFWHADYAFMENPFAFTMVYPKTYPKSGRGTYFVNMVKVYDELSQDLKYLVDGSTCSHSVRKYFKIRPSDVYRPISEVLAEIESETPEVRHPCRIKHPVTGENILFISEGFSQGLYGPNGGELSADILSQLLLLSGQKDDQFNDSLIHYQEFERGDLIIWDNRSLVHCARHGKGAEPTETYRITLHDGFSFSADVGESQGLKS